MNVIERRENGVPRAFELTPAEDAAHEHFGRLLDSGVGIPLAAAVALNAYCAATCEPAWRVDNDFVVWLSDNTVERWGTRFRVKRSWLHSTRQDGLSHRKRRRLSRVNEYPWAVIDSTDDSVIERFATEDEAREVIDRDEYPVDVTIAFINEPDSQLAES